MCLVWNFRLSLYRFCRLLAESTCALNYLCMLQMLWMQAVSDSFRCSFLFLKSHSLTDVVVAASRVRFAKCSFMSANYVLPVLAQACAPVVLIVIACVVLRNNGSAVFSMFQH